MTDPLAAVAGATSCLAIAEYVTDVVLVTETAGAA